MEVRETKSTTAICISLTSEDLTPSNIVFRLKSLDHLNEQGIYRLFGEPFTGPL